MRVTHKSLPLMLLGVLGLLLMLGLLLFDGVVSRGLREEAARQQRARAEELTAMLDARLATSAQVATTLAALVGEARSQRDLEWLLERTLQSTDPSSVHGAGIFFVPYGFERGTRYMGPYVHRDAAGRLVLTYAWAPPAYDYLSANWYQQALEHPGMPFFTEPFRAGDSVYQSVTHTFTDARGALRGMVTVDATLEQLQRLVAQAPTRPEDLFYISGASGALIAHPWEQELLDWARARGRPVNELSMLNLADLREYEREHGLDRTLNTIAQPLKRAGWSVHVATDEAALLRGVHRLHFVVLTCGLVLGAGLVAAALAVRRSLRIEELLRELEEQRRLRRQLATSERKLRQVVDTALDAVMAIDDKGIIVDWNTRAEEMYGWRKEEALGRSTVELLMPERDRARTTHELQGLASSSPASLHRKRREFIALRRGGEEFPIEVSTSAVDDGPRRIYYSFVNDITERRRKEAAMQQLLAELRQRTTELHAILEHMVDGVLVADSQGRLTLVNTSARKLFGIGAGPGELRLTPEVIVRRRFQTPDGRPYTFDTMPLPRALRGEVVRGVDVRVSGKDGRPTIVRINAAPIRDEAERVVAAVALARDVTAAVELERLKDEFLRVAAHELKTPVAVVKSYAQLALRTEAALSPALRRLLEGVNRGADRLDQVVRTLLDASQAQLGALHVEPGHVPVRPLLEDAVARAATLHPRHPFRVRAAPDAHAWGDRERLFQVLLELLDNAARYSPPDSAVDVTASEEEGEVEVAIRDQGVGISRDHMAHIFERFYRPHSGTPHDRGGMGLGLYLSREIIRHHGGQLVLESHPGEGTTVRIRLPRSPPTHVSPPGEAPDGSEPAPATQ
ncbi:PAS domain S-box protein [Myxococcaceae bacterium GXIMD 01537]